LTSSILTGESFKDFLNVKDVCIAVALHLCKAI